MRKALPFTFNFLYYAAVAFIMPFLVLFYQSLGFSGAQIGLLTGITPLVTLVCSPLWTGLADLSGRRRLVMSLSILGAILALVAFPSFTSFAAILALAILYYAFNAPLTAFIDSATMYMLGAEKAKYGQVRVGGTIGFGVMATVAGLLVESYGLKVAFWGGGALLLMGLLVAQKLAHNPQSAGAQAHGNFRVLFSNPPWLLFLLVALVGGIANAGTNMYLLPYMRELGAAESVMGLALTIGTLTEIPLMFLAHHLLRRFKPYGLLMISMLVSGLRLLVYVIVQTPEQVLLVQLLNGFTFPALWIAGVAYSDEVAPPGLSATAQGMFGAMVFGVGAAIGGFLGGALLETYGGRGIYLTFGTIVLASLAVAILGMRLLPKAHSRPSCFS